MRKGRSSRRSRVSRPSIGPKTLQNVEAVAAQPASPKVVIGVSLPPAAPSEPPRAETEAATNLAAVASALPAPAAVPAEAERDEQEPQEPASEQRLKVEAAETIAQAIDNLEAAPDEADIEQKVDAKLEESVEAKAEEAPARAEPAREEEEEKAVVAEARDELTPAAPAALDEESIPPVGDLAVHEKFFSQGDLSALAEEDDDLELTAADKAKRKSAPEVVQRRARFVRYVTWAVGVSAVVCLAAVVRTAFAPSSKTIAAPAQAAMIVESPVAKAAPPPEVAQPATTATAAAAVTTTTTQEAPAPAATEAPTPAAEAEAAKPAPTGDAKEEKAASKKALERGKIAEAIEAGERAVALDETDAEAWLLLGAAYQEKGKLADARRAYASCVKLGTKSKHTIECAQMLR